MTHASKRWRLVCYDVRDPKRYRRLHKILKGYGSPVQFSVFRCQLDDRQVSELRWRLEAVLDQVDALLIVDLCPACAGNVVSRNHVSGWDQASPAFLVLGGSSQASGPFAVDDCVSTPEPLDKE